MSRSAHAPECIADGRFHPSTLDGSGGIGGTVDGEEESERELDACVHTTRRKRHRKEDGGVKERGHRAATVVCRWRLRLVRLLSHFEPPNELTQWQTSPGA
jgi:hypothetical protein